MWKLEFRQNYYRTSFSPTVPPFAARISHIVADGGTWRLKWEHLKAGESNGNLPPRTCPGCSVPEPYRSHDWALVPAKPGLQGWILMNEWIILLLASDLWELTRLIMCKCQVTGEVMWVGGEWNISVYIDINNILGKYTKYSGTEITQLLK